MATIRITYNDRTLSLADWATELDISKAAIGERLAEFSFIDREAFLEKLTAAQKKRLLRPKDPTRTVQKFGGKTPAEWAVEKNVTRQAIHLRLKQIGKKYNSVQHAMNFPRKEDNDGV